MYPLFQYGANPDVCITAQGSRDTSSVASSIYLRSVGSHPVLYHYVILVSQKDDLALDSQQRFSPLVWLYALSMGHRELYTTLSALLRAQEAGVIPVRATALCCLLKELNSRPRTLKQIVRNVIYRSVDRQPGLVVSKLPLPNSLKEYILNFEQ